jgi:WD40 repeat protein
LSFNCSAQGETVQRVTIAADDTAQVDFEVVCLGAAGAIRAAVTTTGEDQDPGGYTIMVDDVPTAPVDPTGVAVLTATTGAHVVSLGDVNHNCVPADPSAIPVVVPLRGEVDLAFAVACQPAPAAGRGHEIAFGSVDEATGASALYSVNEDGSNRARLFPELQTDLSTPVWAPDGSRLAFYARGATDRINVANLESGERIEVPTDASLGFNLSLAWSPDGARLSVAEFTFTSLSAIHVDGSGTDLIDFGCCVDAVQSPSWSPDGTRIAFVGISESDIFGEFTFPLIADLASPGESAPPPACNLGETSDVAWSPDGSRLALSAAGHIFLLDFPTATCTQITTGPWADESPAWSPDGAHLAFSSTRDGNAEIYVMNGDGSGLNRITRNSIADVTPSWRP